MKKSEDNRTQDKKIPQKSTLNVAPSGHNLKMRSNQNQNNFSMEAERTSIYDQKLNDSSNESPNPSIDFVLGAKRNNLGKPLLAKEIIAMHIPKESEDSVQNSLQNPSSILGPRTNAQRQALFINNQHENTENFNGQPDTSESQIISQPKYPLSKRPRLDT